MALNGTPGDRHPLAKAIRAARAWSGKSRALLGAELSVSGGTIGRWERGDWKTDPPRGPMLTALAYACDVQTMINQTAGLLADDPATRFAALARAEAQRPDAHPPTTAEDQSDEGDGGEEQ